MIEWPWAVAAIAVAAYSVQVIASPGNHQAAVLDLIIGITWSVFVLDYLVMLALARYCSRNTHEFAIVALPVLRP